MTANNGIFFPFPLFETLTTHCARLTEHCLQTISAPYDQTCGTKKQNPQRHFLSQRSYRRKVTTFYLFIFASVGHLLFLSVPMQMALCNPWCCIKRGNAACRCVMRPSYSGWLTDCPQDYNVKWSQIRSRQITPAASCYRGFPQQWDVDAM